MRLLVGLGNPGTQYAETRHNAGRIVLDQRVSSRGLDDWRADAKHHARLIKTHDLIIIKPTTYMNLSGQSVKSVCSFWKILPQDILVLHDEIDLSFGDIKTKKGGGHAGHNGLRSIIAELGTNDFARIRVGVGRPEQGGDVSGYVLASFLSNERCFLDTQKGVIDTMIHDFYDT